MKMSNVDSETKHIFNMWMCPTHNVSVFDRPDR